MSAAPPVPPADAYHAVHLPEHPARAGVWRAIAAHLAPWVPASGRVLEIGAGYCHWINAVDAAERVAVDAWPGFAAHAAEGVRALVLDAGRNLRSLGEGTFDVVLASNVLEHFEPDAAAAVVADIAALLRPGGRLLVIQPNFRYAYRHYFDDYTHRSVFTHVSLANVFRAHGFTIEALEPRFLPYSMREVGVRVPAWLVRAYLRSPLKPRAGQMLIVARRA
jgi:SAM-dependent methyltransferase